MSKARKRPFQLYEGRCADDNHVRITNDMLTHPAFLGLSSGAKVLYIYMKDWAQGNDSVKYAASMAKPFMARPAYSRARDELCKAKFIYWVNKPISSNEKHESAIFEFSEEWHSAKKSKGKLVVNKSVTSKNRCNETLQTLSRNVTVNTEKQGLCKPIVKSQLSRNVTVKKSKDRVLPTDWEQLTLF